MPRHVDRHMCGLVYRTWCTEGHYTVEDQTPIINVCTVMCVDVCVDMCMDMCTDMCIDMYIDMCIDMYTDVCICAWICAYTFV